MVAMTWETPGTLPPAGVACQILGPEHQEAMLALVALTSPGPFGPLNPSMGEFLGQFAPDGQLLAMAGERTRAGPWHEVSGVCTHPDHQGKGLGRILTHEVVRRMLLRGESPYLHVRADNGVARTMYRKLGFREVLETPIRVIRRV
jgi:ribosomal protein S18 acetylase RimI-like enzyme